MVSATSYQFKLTITLSIKKIYVFHSLQEIHKIENYVIRMCKIWLHEKVIYFMFFFLLFILTIGIFLDLRNTCIRKHIYFNKIQ
jgi:hypothetical protein